MPRYASCPPGYRSRKAVPLVAMAAFLAGSQSWAAEPDACSLLTVTEASAALGERVQAPQAIQADSCLWRGTGTATVTVESPGTGRPGFDNAKSRTSPVTALSGIGDAAFEFVSAAGFVQISLVKADRFLTLVVQAGNAKTARSAAEGIAAKIASRL